MIRCGARRSFKWRHPQPPSGSPFLVAVPPHSRAAAFTAVEHGLFTWPPVSTRYYGGKRPTRIAHTSAMCTVHRIPPPWDKFQSRISPNRFLRGGGGAHTQTKMAGLRDSISPPELFFMVPPSVRRTCRRFTTSPL